MSVKQNPNISYGLSQALIPASPQPIVSQRAPSTSDKAEIGTIWVDQPNNAAYILTAIVANSANWEGTGGGTGTFTSVTVNPGDLTIVAGNEIITAGNLTLGAGNIVLTAGDITASAGEISAVNFIAANSFETTNGNITVNNTDVGVDAGLVALQKSRAGAIIVTGDELGGIEFWGFDGASQELSARIQVTSTGTIAANRVPSKMDFYTHANAAGDPILAMSIDDNQDVTFSQDVLVPGNAVRAGAAVITNGGIVDADTTATAAGPTLYMTKSRDASFAAVQVGDKLSDMVFFGADGTAEVAASGITAFVTAGTIALDRVPSNLVFFTHPDAATPAVDRMTIASTGEVTIAAPDSGVGLTVAAGGITASAGDIIATAGGLVSTLGDITATNGNVIISTATKGLTLPGGPTIITGAGAPGALVAARGSMYMRTDAGAGSTSLYINTDGAATWVAVTTA